MNWLFSKVSDVQFFLELTIFLQVYTRIELDSKTTVSFFAMWSTFFRSPKFLVKRKNAGKFMLKKDEQKL